MLFTDKYKPCSTKEFLGNSTTINRILDWALEWKDGGTPKPLLLYGSTGVGKTQLALTLATQMGWELFEFNASDLRNKDNVQNIVSKTTSMSTLWGTTRLILIDDIDKTSRVDRGAISAIASVIKETKMPMILTADDYWDQKISSLRTICESLKLNKINKRSIAKKLNYINGKENLGLNDDQIQIIAESSSGDVRAALNDLQGFNINSKRDRKTDIFSVMRTIFKSKDYNEISRISFTADVDHDMLKLWILENVPREYDKPLDCARAFNMLSRADMFDGRIRRRQYWKFFRYSNYLMTVGVAFSKDENYHKYTKYEFPSVIRSLSSSKSVRAKKKAIAYKLKEKVHGSTKLVTSYLPIIKQQADLNFLELMDYYDFDDKEMGYLMGLNATKFGALRKRELKKISKATDVKSKKPEVKKPTSESHDNEETKTQSLFSYM